MNFINDMKSIFLITSKAKEKAKEIEQREEKSKEDVLKNFSEYLIYLYEEAHKLDFSEEAKDNFLKGIVFRLKEKIEAENLDAEEIFDKLGLPEDLKNIFKK